MAAVQFLAGCTFAGGVTYLFHTRIQQQTAQLSADLHALSLKLRTLSPDAAPLEQGVIPTRLPFKESLKARWNQEVIGALAAVNGANYSELAESAWGHAKSGVALVKEKLGPASEGKP